MEKIIHNCKDCPFLEKQEAFGLCGHPDVMLNKEWIREDFDKAPTFCPFRKDPMIIFMFEE